jgi:hypothetical protein
LLALVIGCSLFACADYFGWIKLSDASEIFFRTALQGYTMVAVLSLVIIFLYYWAYQIFKNRLYPEELTVQENKTFRSANWIFLQKFGLTGSWINLELKLIFRNKRSRELLFLHVVFLLGAFVTYTYIKNPNAYGTFLLCGMICSGFFVMNYGQFLFSWQGSHFDFMLVQPTSLRTFVESKYWLLLSTVAIWFLCSIPFVFLGWHFLLINLVASLYNIGINIFIVMNLSMWGAKKIDLRHPGSLNLEGIGAAQWTMAIPLIASPYLFFLPLSLTGYPMLGLAAVGTAGLIGIVFQKTLIGLTSKRHFDRRYIMSSNFRKD